MQEPDDVTALNGEDIILDCEVGGDPNPTVLWHREDGTLPQGRTRVQNGKLIIQSVSPKGKKRALKIYNQFTLNTGCFWNIS